MKRGRGPSTTVMAAAAKSAAQHVRGVERYRAWESGSSEPPRWREVWAAVEAVRRSVPAPVDSDGCERLHDAQAEPRVQRYQALVALMLSAQTRDEVNAATMRGLMAYGLTPERIHNDTSLDALRKMISRVSFYNRKAEFIKEATATVLREYGGDVPPTAEAAMKLRGVGPKMAHLLMQCAWGRSEGIGVDVHVHRIADRLLWSRRSRAEKACAQPEDTRRALEAWLPRDRWEHINPLLVGFGQTVCKAVAPRCSECPLASVCPSYAAPPKSKKKMELKEDEEEETEREVE